MYRTKHASSYYEDSSAVSNFSIRTEMETTRQRILEQCTASREKLERLIQSNGPFHKFVTPSRLQKAASSGKFSKSITPSMFHWCHGSNSRCHHAMRYISARKLCSWTALEVQRAESTEQVGGSSHASSTSSSSSSSNSVPVAPPLEAFVSMHATLESVKFDGSKHTYCPVCLKAVSLSNCLMKAPVDVNPLIPTITISRTTLRSLTRSLFSTKLLYLQ